MSESTSADGPSTRDEELLADLFDTMLQEILDGRTPDLDALHADRPDLRERIEKTWSLACSVAGRREPGRPVFGGYEIVRELGHGGMGTVYLARHQTLQRHVAVKVLPHSLAMSPRAKQRFIEEARALAQLRHDNVVNVHRVVDHTEMLAFEMEYIDGPSLQQLVLELRQRSKPQTIAALADVIGVDATALGTRSSVEWFVRLGIRMARALGAVHRSGLVHRDVKPSNILLRRDGTPVLADFGLALQGELDSQPAKFAGTPVYAAPERLRAGDGVVDARTDIYSLGVTLYEALTLSPPFQGSSTHEVLRRIESGNTPPLRQRAPHVSRDLATIVQKAMEPDPRHRYATADDFADDLERLLNLQPIKAQPAGPIRRLVKFVRRHQKAVLAAGASALLVALASWPLAAYANQREAARQRAARLQLEARSRLLCSESLPAAWESWGADGPQVQQSAARRARQNALLSVRDIYGRALAATPDDVALRLEADAVAAAAALLQPAGAPAPERTLPPLTAQLVLMAGGRRPAPDALRGGLAAADGMDRYAAGLFAFLLGDLSTTRACWDSLPPPWSNDPFVDACTALRLAGEGALERASPRLFHAARTFPQATALAIAVADAAVAAGDLPTARQWLARVPPSDDPAIDARRRLLGADIAAAAGDVDTAQRVCREVAQADASNPEPVQHFAELMLRIADYPTAERVLKWLLQRWPDLGAARLRLARLALLRRDLPGYLQHVRHLQHRAAILGLPTIRPLDDLLRLGGLDLATPGPEPADLDAAAAEPPAAAPPPRFADALPLAAWLPAACVRGIERMLQVAAVYDRTRLLADTLDSRPVGAALRRVWLAALHLPQVTFRLPRPAALALLGGLPVAFTAGVEPLSQLALPHQTLLGAPLHHYRERRLLTRTVDDPHLFFAWRMQVVQDLDGDTLEELCITSPPADGHTGNGRIELYSVDDGHLLRTWEHDDGVALLGYAIADLGDVDGDRCNDLLLGLPVGASPFPAMAALELWSGRTGAMLWRVEDPHMAFGVALAPLGDVDGDRVRDFVVGAPPMNLDQRGRAEIRSGRDGHLLRAIVADRAGTWFGACVADAGDVTNDGIDDVLVAGNYGDTPGVVAVFDAATGALETMLTDDDRHAAFGQTAFGVGDVDQDRVADFAVTAPGDGRQPGRVVVVSGRTGKPVHELRGERPGDGFGARALVLPHWRRDRHAALAVSARAGGPIGNGYVRVFDLRDGSPIQSFAGSNGHARFAYALVDLGDRDGDGLRDLGLMSLRQDRRFALSIVSLADLGK